MSRRRPRYFRLAARGVIAVVLVGALATGAVAATASHGTSYRTAVATRANVSDELQRSGTIEPVTEATVAFPVAGTVASVAAKVGQTITTGETLATLETSSLQADLTAKEASLAGAELTLHNVLNGESAGGSGGSGGSGSGDFSSASTGHTNTASTSTAASTAPSAAAAPTGQRTSGSESNAALAAARAAVTNAQAQVQAALAAAQTALQKATAVCSTPTTPPTTTPTTTTTTTAPSTTSTTETNTDPPTCATAQATVLRDLHTVATAEQTLARAESTLSKLLASSSTSSTNPSTSPTTASSKTASSNTVTYTAKQIAAYEAAVFAASAEVAASEQNLAQALIVSPIAGTIAAVNLTAGATISADSATDNIVIVSNRGYEVTTTLSVADRAKIKIGDAATVVADGTSALLPAKVVAIGAVATSDGTSTYPVVIGFTDATTELTGLRNGASASVTIVAAQSTNALTVPTSAVQTVGTAHTVTVLANGKTTTVRVQVGTVGAERTAIKSGLTAGQVVVLADLGMAIPSSGTSTNSTTGAFSTGLGGAGNFTGGGAGFGR